MLGDNAAPDSYSHKSPIYLWVETHEIDWMPMSETTEKTKGIHKSVHVVSTKQLGEREISRLVSKIEY